MCWCVLVCAGVCGCVMVCDGVCWCVMVYYGVLWCVMVCDGVCVCVCVRELRIANKSQKTAVIQIRKWIWITKMINFVD